MRWLKGCFVFEGDQRSNAKHSKQEVNSSIDKQKVSNLKDLLTVEELSAVVNMTIDDRKNEEDGGETWMDDEKSEDEVDIVMMTKEDSSCLEISFSNSSFTHGLTRKADMEAAIISMHENIKGGEEGRFFGASR